MTIRPYLLSLGGLAAGLVCSALLFGQPPASAPAKPVEPAFTGPRGTVEKITVHGKALEGNLEGDSPDRTVFVYLPPGYSANAATRYPVAYMLHGFGLTGERWMSFANIALGADRGIAAGTTRPMIVVSPDAYTFYQGAMYSNSTATGDWEAFIAKDLVSYIDSHYRTIPERASRGLGGHSMGGYGTMRIGMKYSDVFGSLYAMSSCCLNPQLTPNPETMAPYEALKTPDEAKEKAAAKGKSKSGISAATLASAAAWSANPKNPPFYFDLPVKDGKVRPEIVAKWAANAPLAMVDQYVPQLKQYRAIALEVGLQDTLLRTNQELDALLTQSGVPHTYETYEGDHNNRVPVRIEQNVLPFFSKNLTFK